MLAKSKLDSIETLVSQALTDMEISHEEFNVITGEKQKHERVKENIKNVSEKQENMRLKSVNSKKITILRNLRNHFFFFFFFFFFFCIHKMYLVSAEGYKNAGVHILVIRKTGKIWVSMKDVHIGFRC